MRFVGVGLAAIVCFACGEEGLERLRGPGVDGGARGADASADGGDAGGIDRDGGDRDGALDGAIDGGVDDSGEPIEPPEGELCPGMTPPSSAALTYQIDIAHSGAQPNVDLQLPFSRKWSRTFKHEISYPVVACGRVFVLYRTDQTLYGTELEALDANTGETVWGPVSTPGTYWWAALAYDGGRVFALNFDGMLRAFDAETGALDWELQMPGQYAFSSAPTATRGRVFVGGAGSGGTVYSVDQRNGDVLWTASVANGDQSSPAIAGDAVYVSYACNQAYKFDLRTGGELWHHTSGCSGGGGKTVSVYRDRIYTRDFDGNLILDAASGDELGRHDGNLIPAFHDGLGYFVRLGELRAIDVESNVVTWTFDQDTVANAPLVTAGHVVVGSEAGSLYALDRWTGEVADSTNLGVQINGPDEHNVSQPLNGFSAAEGKLFVAAGSTLIVF